MDPAELTKLEKQVKLHQKGESVNVMVANTSNDCVSGYDKAAATAGAVKEQVQG